MPFLLLMEGTLLPLVPTFSGIPLQEKKKFHNFPNNYSTATGDKTECLIDLISDLEGPCNGLTLEHLALWVSEVVLHWEPSSVDPTVKFGSFGETAPVVTVSLRLTR